VAEHVWDEDDIPEHAKGFVQWSVRTYRVRMAVTAPAMKTPNWCCCVSASRPVLISVMPISEGRA